jgi:hypothetical protein
MDKTYKSARDAKRGAYRAGHKEGDFSIVQIDDRWAFVCENEDGDVVETTSDDLDLETTTTDDESYLASPDDEAPTPENIGDETLGDDDGGPVEPDEELVDTLVHGAKVTEHDPVTDASPDEIEPEHVDEAPADEDTSVADAEAAARVNEEEIKSISAKAIAQIENRDWDGLLSSAKSLVGIADGKRHSSYKEIRAMAPQKFSTRIRPVKFIFDHMDANPMMKRKEALAYFAEQGINYNTAHTQYQRWKEAFAKKQATQAAEDAAKQADKIDGMDRDDTGESND